MALCVRDCAFVRIFEPMRAFGKWFTDFRRKFRRLFCVFRRRFYIAIFSNKKAVLLSLLGLSWSASILYSN